MPVTRIAFVVYPVSNMARAVAFYRDVLGLKLDEEASGERWGEFDVAGTAFAITTVEMVGTPGDGKCLALEVDDLPAFRKALAARGILTPDEHESPVCWMAPVHDPDGNVIVLHQLKP
jgi:predicted enzyme related to lactoylglutathione lyase